MTVHRHQDWDYHSFARFSRTHDVAAAVLAFKFGAEDVAGRQAHLRTQLLDPLLCSMVPGGRLVLGSLLNTQRTPRDTPCCVLGHIVRGLHAQHLTPWLVLSTRGITWHHSVVGTGSDGARCGCRVWAFVWS